MAKAVPSPSPESAPPSFESALAELESVISSMEGGQLTLEASLSAYRRGAELLRHCRAVLEDARQQVQVLDGDALRDIPGVDEL